MRRLDDEKDEMAEAIAEAAKAGPRTADMSQRFLAIVLDAEQAQRQWAIDELAAIRNAGAGARFKRHFKPEPKPIPIRGKVEVDVQQVIGIRRGGEWQQLPLGEVTGEEITATLRARTALRDRATDELVVLRRLRDFYAKHSAAPSTPLADVVAAAGVSIDDVMAGAA